MHTDAESKLKTMPPTPPPLPGGSLFVEKDLSWMKKCKKKGQNTLGQSCPSSKSKSKLMIKELQNVLKNRQVADPAVYEALDKNTQHCQQNNVHIPMNATNSKRERRGDANTKVRSVRRRDTKAQEKAESNELFTALVAFHSNVKATRLE